MRALVFHHPKKVSVDTVDDPRIEKQDDIIIKVTSTAICGSDLHILNGFVPQTKPLVMGHEFMGIIEETGKEIKNLKKGDRVVVPFPIACGNCFFCNHGLTPHCENSNSNYGPEGGILKQKGAALFGYTDLYGGYPGGQAEYVRVPYANFSPKKIDPEMSDEEVLFLTDIFPTGWSAIDWAQLKGGETVVVFGCGPVGIMAQKAAWIKGAGRVIGVDILDYRLQIAAKAANSEILNLHKTDVIQEIRDRTEGRGADVCIDAVGMEAHRSTWEKFSNLMHAQAGTISVIKLCASAVRRGGVISVVGVYGSPYSNFPFGQIFDKGVTIRTGQALVQVKISDVCVNTFYINSKIGGAMKTVKKTKQRPPQKQKAPGIQTKMRPKPVVERDFPHCKLSEKVALITGGDSGIGQAVALAFAKEGANIAIVYLKEHSDAKETQRLVEKEGKKCLLLPGDAGEEKFCKSAVKTVIDFFGRLDILINNAAEQHPQDSIEKISEKQLEKTFRTNIFSYFFMVKASLKYLKKHAGVIINTSSVTAYRGSERLLDYSSTKGAIVAFTRSLALSLVEQGIRVNGVAPGPIWTPLIASTFSPKKIETFGSDVPMKRAGEPAEVASCFVFLASADSSYMTGQILHPNGGEIVNA